MDGMSYHAPSITYGSVCSGIEAASVAWHPLGWKAAFFSETEAFPRAVLTHHYPNTPLHGDFTTIQEEQYDPIDLLVGGTPCQSFSVAGLRGGMADERGNLALEYLRLADRLRPNWLLWENVPGVLSSNGGRDFGAFLGGLVQLGYGFAYRVLDAQHFGLAQRRKRVFVVGYFGDWRRAAAVLFEPASLRRHPAPRRTEREDVARCLTVGANQCSGTASDFVEAIARPLTANKAGGSGGQRYDWETETFVTHTLRAEGHDASEDGTGRGVPLVATALRARDGARGVDSDCTDTLVPVYAIQERAVCQNPDAGSDGAGFREGLAYTLEARQQVQAIAQPYTLAIRGRGDSHDLEYRQDGTANALLTPKGGRAGIGVGAIAFDVAPDLPASTLNAASKMHVAHRAAVRRLTPVECCRLQGFPDTYLDVLYRGKPAADGPKYRVLGNSFAVPVVRWIGQRIAAQHRLAMERP